MTVSRAIEQMQKLFPLLILYIEMRVQQRRQHASFLHLHARQRTRRWSLADTGRQRRIKGSQISHRVTSKFQNGLCKALDGLDLLGIRNERQDNVHEFFEPLRVRPDFFETPKNRDNGRIVRRKRPGAAEVLEFHAAIRLFRSGS